MLMVATAAHAQTLSADTETAAFKPTIDDWIGVNAAVENYTLGLELKDMGRYDKAFWPEAKIIAQPQPGMSITIPYRQAAAGPPSPGEMTPPAGMAPPPGTAPPPGVKPPPGMVPGKNAVGTDAEPWHLTLSHHFEFQSSTKATHYGYFVSVYPDLDTKISIVGLPGHYEDVLEKRGDEWRIIQRTTVIGKK